MTPFMPQQAASVSATATAATGANSSNQDSVEYRSNPLQADNYLLQSLQCQEMMQHYIQSLMAAASRLPSSNPNSSTQASPLRSN